MKKETAIKILEKLVEGMGSTDNYDKYRKALDTLTNGDRSGYHTKYKEDIK